MLKETHNNQKTFTRSATTRRMSFRLSIPTDPTNSQIRSPPPTDEKNKWKKLVNNAIKGGQLRGATCPLSPRHMASENRNENGKCDCGHLLNHHDFEHVPESKTTTESEAQLHTFVKMSAENSGELGNDTRVSRSFV